MSLAKYRKIYKGPKKVKNIPKNNEEKETDKLPKKD
jgi:hypothetical protein